jgi:hypothetical protein
MILPNKHLSQDRALLTVGARVLAHLYHPKTVSSLWEGISRPVSTIPMDGKRPALRYDAFVLALDLLFLMGAIELQDGVLSRRIP